MERLTVDRQGRLILEKGLIRIFTDDLDPERTMLIVDFVKFVLNNAAGATGGAKILQFPKAATGNR